MYIRYLITFVFITSSIGICSASRTCPRGCNCIDNLLITTCDKMAQLDYVPHTLNPAVKELYLPQNNIRGIKSAFDVYKYLTILDLSENSIQTLGEKNFIANSNMKSLLLKNNNITFLKPNTFIGLTSLKFLDLSHNQLEIINSSVFQNLKQLEKLDLSYNNLKNLEKDSLFGLVNLRFLNISHNFIIKLASDVFYHVPNLLNLNVSFNELNHIADEQFNHLDRLIDLDLSNCHINQIEKFAFLGLNNLTTLFLDNNNLELIPSDSFLENNVIKILYIGQNPFQSIYSKSFSKLKLLKRLYISNASLLTEIHVDAFYGLENLEMLELSNNEMLEYLNRNVFDNLFSLSSLILSNNNFTTIDIDLINRYKKLDLYLDVRGNPFFCNCSLEWLNFHLLRMFNKTISYDPHYFLSNNVTFPIQHLDALLNNNYSDIIIKQNALDVRCSEPFSLNNKLIIKLHKDKFGCFVLESIIPIIIGGLIGLLIITGVVALSIIRCKYQLSGFVKNQFYAENEKNDLNMYYKPEFVFVPSYNDIYRGNRMTEDLSVHYPLKMTPTTEL